MSEKNDLDGKRFVEKFLTNRFLYIVFLPRSWKNTLNLLVEMEK